MDLNAGRRRKMKWAKRAWKKFVAPKRFCDVWMCGTKLYEHVRKERAI